MSNQEVVSALEVLEKTNPSLRQAIKNLLLANNEGTYLEIEDQANDLDLIKKIFVVDECEIGETVLRMENFVGHFYPTLLRRVFFVKIEEDNHRYLLVGDPAKFVSRFKATK